MLQEYNTESFKEKKNATLQKRINYLLSELPDYCQPYELFLRQTSVIKTRAEYLQDIYIFFRYMALKNPGINSAKEVKLSDLEQLNGFDFDDYSAWLIEYRFNPNDENETLKHNSNVTRKRKFASLKSLFHYLYVRDYISCNPSEKAIVPKVWKKKRKDIRILEDNESSAFIQAIDEEYERCSDKLEKAKSADMKISKQLDMGPALALRDKAIVFLFLGTGLRVSELCAIDCSNISPLGYINVIRKEDSDEDKTTDKVYVGDKVQDALNMYLKYGRDKIGAAMDNYDALFLSSKHERITPRGVELMIKKYADRALGTNSGITPHKLRATFGTRYYALTGDISATSTVMNHSSIEVTASYYLREDKDAKEKGADVRI